MQEVGSALALALLLGAECKNKAISIDDTATSETDADVDADADGDTEVECDETVPTPPGSSCPGDSIACGDDFVSTTFGGSSDMTGEEYQTWFCLIGTENDYDGPERAYTFQHPGTGDVNFNLATPCGDLDIIVLAWGSDS
jgi:hypothetical protein